MLYVEPIVEVLEAVIASNYVVQDGTDRVVANLALVNVSGSGKSRMIRLFSEIESLKLETNTSYDQVVKTLLPQIERGEIKVIAFPEFNKILARKEATRVSTLGILNALIDEGIDGIDMPNVNISFNPPLKCGVVLGVTTSIFQKYFLDWWEIGFVQRHLIESWSYTRKQVNTICKHIEKRKFLEEGIYADHIDVMDVELPSKEARKMRKFAVKMTEKSIEYATHFYKRSRIPMMESSEGYPFRYLKVLNLMQMTYAGLRGKSKVHRFDTARLIQGLHWMNLDRNELPEGNKKRGKP